jgi:hypothetical protein
MPWTTIALDEYLDALPVRRRTLSFRPRAELAIPAFAGALWHAVLGPALRLEACRAPRGACEQGCVRPESCAFGAVMQSTPPAHASAPLARLARTPGPLVFDTAPWRERVVAPGEPFEIALVIVGRGTGLMDVVARAIERAARQGLGRARVAADYEGAVEAVGLARLGPLNQPLVPAPGADARHDLRLHIRTPLRLKGRGTYVRDLDIDTLVRDLSFRVAALGHYHGDLPWPAPWAELAGDTAAVRIGTVALRWVDASRYSARQRRSVVLGGLMGTAELHGVGPSLARLLAAGTVLHAGKGTSMGFGQIAIEALGAADDRAREEGPHAAR